ncbi:MAG: DUF4124 domain-containing protein [Pseudomonadales bacterium]
MNRPSIRALLSIALASIAFAASADQVYRWVDEDGVVNYTQQKPRGTASELLTTSTGAPRVMDTTPAPIVSPATGQELNADQQKMLEGLRAVEQARKNEIAKIKQENCQKSRSVLSRLTIKNRIRVKDETGEYQIMGEDERQERIQKAQEGIAQYCAAA